MRNFTMTWNEPWKMSDISFKSFPVPYRMLFVPWIFASLVRLDAFVRKASKYCISRGNMLPEQVNVNLDVQLRYMLSQRLCSFLVYSDMFHGMMSDATLYADNKLWKVLLQCVLRNIWIVNETYTTYRRQW